MVLLVTGDAQMLCGELLGGVHELKQHGSMAGLEPAALGRGQSLLRELEAGDGLEGVPDAIETRFEPGGQRSHR